MAAAEETEDVRTVSKAVFCCLFLLFALLSSRADESAGHPGSQGEYLARAGDCVACHSVAGGKAFAGGLKMGSPLGAIYSTNITPDREMGIGSYSLEDFARAVRAGVANYVTARFGSEPSKITARKVAELRGETAR